MYKKLLVAAIPLMMASTMAWAQDGETGPQEEATGAWEIDAEIGAFSDYRFRGISLSSKDPQVTAEISVAHESGFYAGVWASNVALDDGADDVEIDLSVGFSKELGAVTFDVGGVYYLYPEFSEFNYVELYSSLTANIGPVETTLGVAYAPSQDNIGDEDNIYVFIAGDMPVGETPLSLHGSFGIEDGAFGDRKRDWKIGASYDLGSNITATLDYVDTARAFSPLGDATAVFSLTMAF